MSNMLIDIIPKEEIIKKFNSGFCELDPDFLCFEDVYQAIARNVPKDYTIVDLGCYMAAQSYLFTDFKEYIGVDGYDIEKHREKDGFEYIAPDRFSTSNTRHFQERIQDFMENMDLDLDKTYFIASYVPDFDAVNEAFDKVKHMAVKYCNFVKTKGINAEQIEDALKEFFMEA